MQGSINGIENGYIERIIIQQTGTFNQMFNRPFELNLNENASQTLAHCIAEQANAHSGALTIEANAIAPLISNCFKPVAQPDSHAIIDNGWGNNRCRFVMSVVMKHVAGYEQNYCISGYTNYFGMGQNGSIDHDMVFHVNNVIKSKKITRNTPSGIVHTTQINENSHLINNPSFDGFGAGNNLFTMRPADIFSNIALKSMESDNLTGIGLNNLVTEHGSKINRDHYIGSKYLSNMINSWSDASMSEDGNTSYENICARASKTNDCRNPSMNNDEFLRSIKNFSGSYAIFKFRDLLKFDMAAEQRIHYQPLKQDLIATLPQAGQFAYMNGTDLETIIATEIAQALPAIVTSLNATKVKLFSTNNTMGGVVDTVIMDCKGMIQNYNYGPISEAIKIRVNTELIPSISQGNMFCYTIMVDCDTYGTTSIQLTFENNPTIEFMIPSFCDSTFSSLLTNNGERPKMMSNDVSFLFDELDRVRHETGRTSRIQVAQQIPAYNNYSNAISINHNNI